MLTNIQIQNYAIIEKLDLAFQKGFTAITGETGAGKSIILGALGLVMGKRADSKVLYLDGVNCIVEASFDIAEYSLKSYFEENDLPYFDELVIRREILTNGKSRSFVNDSLVNLGVLNTLSSYLIDLHQQFDILDLFQNSFQLEVIDALAGNEKNLIDYKSIFKKYNSSLKALHELKEERAIAIQEKEYLEFQFSEFENLNLVIGEQEEIEIELGKLNNAEDIKRITISAADVIEESDQSITSTLRQLNGQLNTIAKFDSNIEELNERLNQVIEEIRDIASEFSSIGEDTDFDPQLIAKYEERLNEIYRLQKKHNRNSVEELIEIQSELETKLLSYTNLDDSILKLEKETDKSLKELINLGKTLTNNRKAIAKKFEEDVHNGLVDLSMEHAYIKVDIDTKEKPSPSGFDNVQFLFAPNKGSQFLPLKDIASGGETSRLTLVIKSLVAGAMTMPTLIFDEIDLGVSGEVASKMGKILKKLALNHQLITISHSAQIASKADQHYFAYKKETEERTITGVDVLDKNSRITEIAKMLSGDPPSQIAMENAKELLS
jgi:DNA repair protein RecN (Recombination protein N)